MPNVVSLTDGTTTIGLSSSGCTLMNYMPSAPEAAATGAYKNVVESIEFMIIESSVALTQTKLANIDLLLQNARRAQQGLAPRVYLLFQTESDATALRSEIVDYRLDLGEDAAVGLYQQRLECRLLLTRLFYWEGAEVELQLSTSNQAAATGGRTIRNHDDAGTGDDNWVQIASNQVSGSLPAACRVQLQNTIGAGRQFTKIFIGLNALSDPANFTHVIEGESRLSGGSVDTSSAYSNGQALSFSLGSGSTPTTTTFAWTLSASTLSKTAGRPVHLLARFADIAGTVTIRAEVRDANSAGVLWRGDAVALPNQYGGVIDLGVLPLPPGGYSSSYGALVLTLICTGVALLWIDFLQLTPMDSFVLLECLATVGNNDSIVYDSVERRQYVLSGSSQLPYVAASGSDILLHPGKTQRLIVLEQNTTTPSRGEITDSFAVRCWYRPRRITV